MADRLRIGVIGTSWWAEAMHLPAIASHPRASLAALCGRNSERAAEMAAKHGAGRVFADWRAMLESRTVDAVVIAVPDDLHREMTLAALDAGLHVVCEKPLALNVSEAREMLDRADAAGVTHMTYFTWRWIPQFRMLKRLVQDGRVGEPIRADFQLTRGNGAATRPYHWAFDAARANGILGLLGSHMIDMARWMLGEITDVHARLATVTRQENPAGSPAANDLAHLSLEHAGGALSSVVAGGASPTHEWLVTVVGRDGTLAAFLSADALRRVQGAPPYWVRWRPHTDNSFQEVPIADDLWEGALRGDQMSVFTSQRVGCRLFIDAILRGERVEPSFRDGWEVQQVMDAALRSQAEGLTVALCDPRGAVGGRAR